MPENEEQEGTEAVVLSKQQQRQRRTELAALSIGALQKKLVLHGADLDQLGAALDAEDPKAALIALIQAEELASLSIGALQKQLVLQGADLDQLGAALDATDPKAALIALVLAEDGTIM